MPEKYKKLNKHNNIPIVNLAGTIHIIYISI